VDTQAGFLFDYKCTTEASPTHIQNNNHVAMSSVAMHFDLMLSPYSQFAAPILGLLGGQDVLVDRTLIIVSSACVVG